MDRTKWRRERRLWNEVQMDTIYARQYDKHWGHISIPLTNKCSNDCSSSACREGAFWMLPVAQGSTGQFF